VPSSREVLGSALGNLVFAVSVSFLPITAAFLVNLVKKLDSTWLFFAAGASTALLLHALLGRTLRRPLRYFRYHGMLEELLAAAKQLAYPNHSALYAFQLQARIVLERAYGPKSQQLNDFDEIWLVSRAAVRMNPQDDWQRGRAKYIILLRTFIKELKLF